MISVRDQIYLIASQIVWAIKIQFDIFIKYETRINKSDKFNTNFQKTYKTIKLLREKKTRNWTSVFFYYINYIVLFFYVIRNQIQLQQNY